MTAAGAENSKGGAARDGAALEIVLQDAAGARAALAGGADRLELCTGLHVGGLTPSAGTVEAMLETGAGHQGLAGRRRGAGSDVWWSCADR
ncbi:hypothetical protein ART_3623 [Arthrobacter sp. PAMC 25486]|uniref:copper homeostasis protein CutC n=1 Tax=Arthrobacter sp. PAMC 25486 TaxID=1494608 RepID=UPI00053623AB|nr:copper homeostasis protein CutC [Arthrobacter sp. PAMC 25486]AIY03222.1 hypothetical protein ART_3623 [Arthrobacter sp. PAMC 25486]